MLPSLVEGNLSVEPLDFVHAIPSQAKHQGFAAWEDDDAIVLPLTDSNGTAEIPKDILADPILLLKWLEEQSADDSKKVDELDSRIIELIDAEKLDYIDQRNNGGRLWVFGGYELADFVIRCLSEGFRFHLIESGSKAIDGFDAWWCEFLDTK